MTRIRKTISVDIDETVDAQVTLDVDEIVEFIKECNADEKNEIIAALGANVSPVGISVNTINDLMRFELLAEAFKKYDIFELEKRLA